MTVSLILNSTEIKWSLFTFYSHWDLLHCALFNGYVLVLCRAGPRGWQDGGQHMDGEMIIT